MAGYLLDTSIVSVYLDPSHPRHAGPAQAIAALPIGSDLHVSAVALAEIEFGLIVANMVSKQRFAQLEQMLAQARRQFVLDVTKQTARFYADIKARVAHRYLASTLRRDRPSYVEEWIDRATGKAIAIDENDLWMCAQAKERDLTLLTAERRMSRISDADPEVRILRV
jgi:predicted nucleic acid-binding protein